jgi:hypothetical protein
VRKQIESPGSRGEEENPNPDRPVRKSVQYLVSFSNLSFVGVFHPWGVRHFLNKSYYPRGQSVDLAQNS